MKLYKSNISETINYARLLTMLITLNFFVLNGCNNDDGADNVNENEIGTDDDTVNVEGNLLFSEFKFPASSNTSLSSDVEAFKLTEAPSQLIDSLLYVIFPDGTDFSQLKPEIEVEENVLLEYRLNDNAFTEYPSQEMTLNLRYPNTLDFRLNKGQATKTYRVIADVANPIQFEMEEVAAPDMEPGNTYSFLNIIKWTNVGNYPITALSPNTYSDIVTPIAGQEYRLFTVSLDKDSPGELLPGEEGAVQVVVSNTPSVEGEYSVMANFNITFDANRYVVSYLSSETIPFVEDIYAPVHLKVSGNVQNPPRGEIISYGNITLGGLDLIETDGAFFSTTSGQVVKGTEIPDDVGSTIDIAYVGLLGARFFESPKAVTDWDLPAIPDATDTKFINSVNESSIDFSVDMFDAMEDDSALKEITIISDDKSLPLTGVPFIVLFENEAGKKGAIKVTDMTSSQIDGTITFDIKMQK